MSDVAGEVALAAAFGTGIIVGIWLAFRALKSAAEYLREKIEPEKKKDTGGSDG